MATIHLVSVYFMSPFFIILLFSSHIFLDKHSSCLALRFTDEQGSSIKWENSANDELAREVFPDNELDYLLSLDRATRGPKGPTKNQDDLNLMNDNLAQHSAKQSIDDSWNVDSALSRAVRLQSNADSNDIERKKRRNDVLFLIIVGVSSLVGIMGLIAAAVFWYKVHKRAQSTLDAEYPSYGVTGPGSGGKVSPNSTISDRKLAQSAQMFHYQQQRQQMMAQEKSQLDAKPVHSDDSDDELPGGGDYTVFECPGLAPTGEMEVRNPLFTEPDSPLNPSTSAAHPTTNNHYPQPSATAASSSPPKEKLLS